ncbi:MAG: bifunctional riboflavin kinase/FAD synthetase, partial [Pseudomonadota bacterium]
PAHLTGGTVAIGNFDGVHRGHQAVLGAALKGPRPVVAMTFEPHPRAFFKGAPIFRLTPPQEKAELIKALGLDGVVVTRFDAALAGLTADAFIDDILRGALNVKHVAVGHDFKFGSKRSGNAARLSAAGGFSVDVVDAFDDGSLDPADTPDLSPLDTDPAVVSSSRIRAYLGEGNVADAARLLGYRYQVVAPVVHGEKRGRTIGFPTANQALDPTNRLRHGVYAVRMRINDVWCGGVANFGRRPTFDNGAPLLETHVFGFSGDLYGTLPPVTLVSFIRAESKFDGIDALMAQITADSEAARLALAGIEPLTPLDAAVNF